MTTTRILAVATAVTLLGCIDTGDDGEQLDEVVSGACVPTVGGHEICDGVDNDCDGKIDKECGPINPSTVTPYACGVSAGFIAVGSASAVFVARSHQIDRVAANGVVTLAVNTTVPQTSFRIARSPSGRMFIAGYSSLVGPHPYSAEINAFSAQTGAHMAVLENEPVDWQAHAFAIDPFERFYVGGGDIYRWEGNTFVPWAVGAGHHMLSSTDGSSMLTASQDLFGVNLVRAAPGASPVVLDDDLTLNHRWLFMTGLVRDNAGRVYVSGTCGPKGGCGAVFRYEANGQHRVLLVASEDQDIRRIAYDTETNELVVGFSGCAPIVTGSLRRIPL